MSGLGRALRRRFDGTHEVDPWGLDADVHALLAPLAARLPVDVDGTVPAGAVLVVTRRRLLVAVGLLRAVGRPPRVLGLPDVEPAATAVRRLGAVVDHPSEAGALLRAGHLVVGRHDAAVMAVAEAMGAPVLEASARRRPGSPVGSARFALTPLRRATVTPLAAAVPHEGV